MKKNIRIPEIALFVCLTLFGSAQNFMPDTPFSSGNSTTLKWFEDGTAFCSHNGATYAFVWQKEKAESPSMGMVWYPYVYVFSNGDFKPFPADTSSRLKFGYKHEDDAMYMSPFRNDVTITGNAYAFSYYGFLWFNCVIKYPPYEFYYPGSYYDLWARYDYDSLKWTTWCTQLNNEPANYKVGACQVDSLLHVIYYNGSTEALREDIYSFDKVSRQIVFKEHSNMNLSGTKFGGMFAYKDTCGNTNYIYNTYTEGYTQFVTIVSPLMGTRIVASPMGLGVGASVMVQGSAKGNRPTETLGMSYSNRFNVFFLNTVKKSDNSYPLYDWEWFIPDNCLAWPFDGRLCEVTLPATCVPQKIDGHYQLGLSTVMEPKDFATEVADTDGLSKLIQVFYPDDGGHFYGGFFNSDFWRPVPGSTVRSTDLANDTTYGPEIRKLWTLVGITDGAPPCSINWNTWDSLYGVMYYPTEMTFSVQHVCNSEVTTTYEDSYSMGGSINAGIEGILGMDLSFEYANTFKNSVSSGHQITTKLDKNFNLNDESQQYGYYLWNIPVISRTSYMVYPWYDATLTRPISTSLQYQFRTESATLKRENIPISKFPFEIDDPNHPHLLDFTEAGRPLMMASAIGNGLQNMMSLEWNSPNEGDDITFSEVDKTVNQVETTNSYSWDESSSFGVPGVFQMSMNAGMSISYSSGYTYETAVGNEVLISLRQLTKQSYGVNFSNYTVNVYWFKPGAADWWYLDSLAGQNPWYIGYIVSDIPTRLVLLSPAPGSDIKDSDAMFTWKAEDGELTDYELFISTTQTAGPGSTIYRLRCGDKTAACAGDFKPEPGKTYYWAVRGFAPGGETVWSDSRTFFIGDGSSETGTQQLKATVYPNPAGRNQPISVACDMPEAGVVSIRIFDINGHLLEEEEQKYMSEGITNEILEFKSSAQGIYFIQIQTEKTSLIKKLIIY